MTVKLECTVLKR